MVKASELRIGNKVTYKDQVDEVLSIHDSGSVFLSRGLYVRIRNIHPVPLTRDLLLEYGFIESYEGIFQHGRLTEVFNTLKEFFFRYDGKIIASCKYLHELQNIYFSLYREEIKVYVSAVLTKFKKMPV